MHRPAREYLPARRPDKPIAWRGSSLIDVRDFPDDARTEAGYQLHLLQQGKQPDDWKPMSTVGGGVYEIRIHTAAEYRVLVVTKFSEALYVLHAFEKKSQKTPNRDLELARRRYHDLIVGRAG